MVSSSTVLPAPFGPRITRYSPGTSFERIQPQGELAHVDREVRQPQHGATAAGSSSPLQPRPDAREGSSSRKTTRITSAIRITSAVTGSTTDSPYPLNNSQVSTEMVLGL